MPGPQTPLLATDCVILDAFLRVLLIRRKHPPYQGAFALPGGLVEIGETVEGACRRELLEETGLRVESLRLLGIYSEPSRDPRGHVCSIAYLGRIDSAVPVAGDDAAAVEWVADWKDVTLAFDHGAIIADAIKLAT